MKQESHYVSSGSVKPFVYKLLEKLPKLLMVILALIIVVYCAKCLFRR